MAKGRNRYKVMELRMTQALIGESAVFLLYLLFAGFGVVWLKVLLSMALILVSGAGIAFLYLNGELLKERSRWMSIGFAAILLCVLVSLITNYPSPTPIAALPPVQP